MSAVSTGKFRGWIRAVRKFLLTRILLIVDLNLPVWDPAQLKRGIRRLPVIRRRHEGAKLPTLQNCRGRVCLCSLNLAIIMRSWGPTHHPPTGTLLQLLRQHKKFLIQVHKMRVLILCHMLKAENHLICKYTCIMLIIISIITSFLIDVLCPPHPTTSGQISWRPLTWPVAPQYFVTASSVSSRQQVECTARLLIRHPLVRAP